MPPIKIYIRVSLDFDNERNQRQKKKKKMQSRGLFQFKKATYWSAILSIIKNIDRRHSDY